MGSSFELGFGDDLRKKMKEVAWFVAIALLRWLIDRLTRDNPGGDDDDAESKHE